MREFSILRLKLAHIDSEAIFPSYLRGHGEMIDFLVFLQVLEKLVFIVLIVNVAQPAQRKDIGFCLLEVVVLQGKLDKLCVTFYHTEKKGGTSRVVIILILLSRSPGYNISSLILKSR